MKFRDAPIQRKLQSIILTTSVTVILLIVTAYLVLEYFSFRRIERNTLLVLGEVIASNSSAALAFDSEKDANEILAALKANPHIVGACLYDQDDKFFTAYPPQLTAADFPAHPEGAGYRFTDQHIEGFTPVMQGGEWLGTLYLKSDLSAMFEQLRQYTLIGLLLIIGSLLVAYFISKILQRSISEPILSLEQTAKSIAEKRDYTVRAPKFGDDEVGSLTQTFNRMLAQIDDQNREILSFNQNLEMKIKERTTALQEQKDFVETIINSSVDLIAVFDRDLRYIMLNSRADHYYEIPHEQMIGKQIFEVFPALHGTAIQESLEKALQGEAIHDPGYRSPLLNRTFENYYIPLQDNLEKVYGVLLIGHDITNIMEANEQLESLNTELMKSNRDLEQFAYVASHDLQEPLRKIQTFVQLMEKHPADEKRVEYQTKIRQAASRMQALIQDVLNFSRLTKTEEAFRKTDLNQILEHLRNDFELIIREKEAVITNDPLPVIRGIPLQLTQLLSNLLSNALKYNDKKPVIHISVGTPSPEEIRTYPRLFPAEKYVKLTFEDNGIGFEPEFSEKIFKIFQRLHGKQTYSGTGIGLAICKKIVENHNGIIYATGEPNKGAKFIIILPVNEDSPTQK